MSGGDSYHVSVWGVRRGAWGCPQGARVRGGIADAKGFPPDLSGHKNHAPTSRNCEKEGIPIHMFVSSSPSVVYDGLLCSATCYMMHATWYTTLLSCRRGGEGVGSHFPLRLLLLLVFLGFEVFYFFVLPFFTLLVFFSDTFVVGDEPRHLPGVGGVY